MRKISYVPSNNQNAVAKSKNRGRLASYDPKGTHAERKLIIENENEGNDWRPTKFSSRNHDQASPKILTKLRNRGSNFSSHFNFTREFELFQSVEVKKKPLLEERTRRSINKVDGLKAALVKKLVKKKISFKSPSSTDCNTINTADCTPIKISEVKNSLKSGKFLFFNNLPTKKRKTRKLKKSVHIFNPTESCCTILKSSQTNRSKSKEKSNSSYRVLTILAPLKKQRENASQNLVLKKSTIIGNSCKSRS